MGDVLKVFVGAVKWSGTVVETDSRELYEMGVQKNREGWFIGADLDSTEKHIAQSGAKVVRVSGGLAGLCVAESLKAARRSGAVGRVSLRDIRHGVDDNALGNSNPGVLSIRRSNLREGLKEYANDPLIVIEE